MAVIQQPSGLTHFVIVWRRLGRKLQVMDPATGRRWTPIKQFQGELYIHEMIAPAETWREWAQSDEFTRALRARMIALGITPRKASKAITRALGDPSWRPIATLDTAVRMLTSLARTGAFKKRAQMFPLLTATVARALDAPQEAERLIPQDYTGVRSRRMSTVNWRFAGRC
jgi:hypothetical protein